MTPETGADAVRIADLRFRWAKGGPLVLDIPELTVKRGERVFMLGPSGSGKTSLLNVIGGVARPESGEVAVLGQDYAALGAAALDRFRAENIGFIFQMFNLIPYLSMVDNVAMGCRFAPERRRRAGDVRRTAHDLLAALGLGDLAGEDRPVSTLSIGQQQRVAAARAVIGGPGLVIADEPTSALDADNRTVFLGLVTAACTQAGAALLFVSHDRALAPHFDRVLDLPAVNRAGPGRAAA